MASVYVPKQRVIERWNPKPKVANQACRKVSYIEGDAYASECGEPTGGKTYCKACAEKLLKLTDRAPPEQPAPKPYGWASDQIFPRKRA
jgi:hypothetical protein